MTDTTTPAVISAAPVAVLSIKDSVLEQFKEAETTLTAMAAKYHNVAYAVATAKGMKEAKDARADLRDNGRLFVTKAETRIKGEVNELKRVMADEVTRLVAIVKPVEDAIDAQIKAEEDRKAAEKAERDRIEADRVNGHRTNIETLKGYVSRADGQPMPAIERAVTVLDAMDFGPEWEEFADEAKAARDAAVYGLKRLIATENQRLENLRLQQELADALAVLKTVTATKPDTLSQEFVDLLPDDDTPVNVPPAAPAPAHSQVVQQMPASVRQAMAPKPTTPPGLRIGEIANRLGFGITESFLRHMDFVPAGKQGASVLYHETDFPLICQALITHISEVQEQYEPETA